MIRIIRRGAWDFEKKDTVVTCFRCNKVFTVKVGERNPISICFRNWNYITGFRTLCPECMQGLIDYIGDDGIKDFGCRNIGRLDEQIKSE